MKNSEKPVVKTEVKLEDIISNWNSLEVKNIQDNTNLGAHGGVFKIETPDGFFALKKYDLAVSKRIEFLSKVYNFMISKGFESFPKPLLTKLNKYFHKDTVGNSWEIAPWIEGQSLSSIPLDEHIVKDVSNLIARFNKSTSDFQTEQNDIIDKDHFNFWVTEMLERRDTINIAMVENNHSFGEVSEYLIELYNLSQKIIHDLTSENFSKIESSLPSCVIHADLTFDHIIKNDSDYKIIDFDRMRYGKRIVDIERLVSECSISNPSFGDLSLRIYQETNPLTDEEIKLLPLFIAYQRTRRAYWRADRLLRHPELISAEKNNFKQELKMAIDYLKTL